MVSLFILQIVWIPFLFHSNGLVILLKVVNIQMCVVGGVKILVY